MKYLFLISLFILEACSDTDKASISALGISGHIRCFSGDIVILDTHSTGRIQTVGNSDGWELKDAQTGKFVRVSGPCVIEN
jgi:hypothetical protein